MTRKRDTVLRGRVHDFRGLKTRFRREREHSGPVRRVAGSTPHMSFADAEEIALLTALKDVTDDQFLEFLETYADVDRAARRILRRITA